jgi:hypothetical protein
MPLSSEEREQLTKAKFLLENPSLAAKITGAIGTPIEKGFGRLPAGWQASIQKATKKALMSALKVAVGTMNDKKSNPSSPKLHKGLVALSGAVGGAFGLPALADGRSSNPTLERQLECGKSGQRISLIFLSLFRPCLCKGKSWNAWRQAAKKSPASEKPQTTSLATSTPKSKP